MPSTADHHCVEVFLTWLSKTSPCSFARSFAAAPGTKKPRIVCSVFLERLTAADLADAHRTLDDCAEHGEFGALLFPRLRTPEDIAGMMTQLAKSDRWEARRVEWKKISRDDRAVGLHWTTSNGDLSSAMGFAPLGSMPVPRRSPYVALVVWPGGKTNPFLKSKGPVVGFIDGDHGMTQALFKQALARTTTEVVRIFGDPQEDPIVLRDVAFCLPKTIGDDFFRAHRL